MYNDDKYITGGVIDLFSLSEDQIFLCQCRQSLLQYLERLNTYEVQ